MPTAIYNFDFSSSSKVAIYTKGEKISYKELGSLIEKAPKLPFINAEPKLETILAILSALIDERPLFLQNPHFPPLSLPALKNPGLYLATSGSTGTPKIALLSKENIYCNARGVNAFLHLSSQDVWELNLPLFHVGGIGALLRSLWANGSVCLGSAKDIATITSLVPTQLYRQLESGKELAANRKYIIGGSPLSSQLKAKAESRGLQLYLTYGMTEMASMVTLGMGNLGKPLPDRELHFASDKEILLSGKTLFQGYLQPNGELSQKAPPFASGDIGSLDSSGNLVVQGRKSRMFIKGGENIHPEEIEKALLEIKGIVEAYVIGIANEEYGELPIAFVRGENFCKEKIEDQLKSKIGSFKVPSYFFPMPEYTGLKPTSLALKEKAASLLAKL